MIDTALALAAEGFYVFPLKADSKLPAIKSWPGFATRDEVEIRNLFEEGNNVGIFTGRFAANDALLVVDVDNKGDKYGDGEVLRLELEGHVFPPTREQHTPTGGRHLVYRCGSAVKSGAGVLGPGLDIRSGGAYIVGAGSSLGGKPYTADDHPISPAPEWLVERCGAARKKSSAASNRGRVVVNIDAAMRRAIDYLENHAPLAYEDDGGDHTTYVVACKLKDYGLDESACLEVMLEHWNDRCPPPWMPDELAVKVANAYKYGVEAPGSEAPEAQFDPLPDTEETKHPFDELNKEFAFTMAGGGHHILWETTDAKGNARLEHLNEASFHRMLAGRTMQIGEKVEPLTKLWMTSPRRRSYKGICFVPGKTAATDWYNLWRGYRVTPIGPGDKITAQMQDSVDAFLEHAHDNICRKDQTLSNWLIGYFAHLVQRPWEKVLVAPVFRGGKGVGKNALVDRVGHLLGSHYLLSSNRRYLVGNFNGHLESCLLLTLDEAFWSGDKQAEGILKDLITGVSHVIEHKGKEPYTVDNFTRVCVIGNEEWLVPASHDERRYSVFDVGDGRKQDRAYFRSMREGMEAGGYRLLLRYLLDYDITGLDFDGAILTEGLLDQKLASQDPFYQWWMQCLTESRIVHGDFDGWPEEVERDWFRTAFRRYEQDRRIKTRGLDSRTIGRLLRGALPVVRNGRKSGNGPYTYKLPPLAEARVCFEKFVGHKIEWEE